MNEEMKGTESDMNDKDVKDAGVMETQLPANDLQAVAEQLPTQCDDYVSCKGYSSKQQ